MRTPLALEDQIARLRAYMRTLRADMNRAYREDSASYLKRRICPFVESLRNARNRNAHELYEVAEECMNKLKHVRALGAGEFFPGEHVLMEVVMKGFERPPERFIVTDVVLSRRNTYNYQVWQVTKSGELFKRGPSLLCPSNRIRITRCELPLPEDRQRDCDHFRDYAREFIANVIERGKIDEIVKHVRQRRAKSGFS